MKAAQVLMKEEWRRILLLRGFLILWKELWQNVIVLSFLLTFSDFFCDIVLQYLKVEFKIFILFEFVSQSVA